MFLLGGTPNIAGVPVSFPLEPSSGGFSTKRHTHILAACFLHIAVQMHGWDGKGNLRGDSLPQDACARTICIRTCVAHVGGRVVFVSFWLGFSWEFSQRGGPPKGEALFVCLIPNLRNAQKGRFKLTELCWPQSTVCVCDFPAANSFK